MIDRRDFIAGTTLLGLTPALAFLPLGSWPIATDSRPVVFLIEGWDTPDDGHANHQIWFKIGRSWRTAWR